MIKKLVRWAKKNPVFAFIFTAGIIFLIYQYRKGFEWLTKSAFDMEQEKFSSPVKVNPVRISEKFGSVDSLHSTAHNGVDLAVMLENVYAPMDGKCFDISNVVGGIQLQIQHTNGFKTGYAHLSKICVKNGEEVKKGDLVAVSGNSGDHTTGYHLHLTLTNPFGFKVDPEKYFDFGKV